MGEQGYGIDVKRLNEYAEQIKAAQQRGGRPSSIHAHLLRLAKAPCAANACKGPLIFSIAV